MPHAETDGKRIRLTSEYRDRDLIDMVPGSRWDPETRTWSVPLSWSSCKIMRGLFQQRLSIGEKLFVWAQNELDDRINPALQLREALDGKGDERLYPFQKAGVEFLVAAEHALLADEMGTGKTIQTIMAMEELLAYPALVIAPNSVKMVWRNEYAKWAPHRSVEVVMGSAKNRREVIMSDADVVVINWESVRLHSRLAPFGSIRLDAKEKELKELNRVDWLAVVADEAHRMKSPRAKQTRAVWAVGHQKSVQRRYALTGTPIANAPDDLWSILHFIDPNEWPTRTAFIERYCQQSFNGWGMEIQGIKAHMKEEFYQIVDPRMRRMPKELVLPQLPPKIRQTRMVELPTKIRKAYDQMERHMITAVEEGTIMATNPIAQFTRLGQFSSAYAEVNEEGNVRLSEPSPKINEMMDILDELGEEPVVVAAESRQLIELAATRLDDAQKKRVKESRSPYRYSYGLIVGGMSEQERDKSQSDFNAGRTRALLFTMKAGGVGLSFTRAGYGIFLQRSWSSVDNKQSEDRIHRIGSEEHDKVVIIDIIAHDTVEEGQVATLAQKAGRLEEVVRDRDLIRRLLERGG